MCLKQIDLFVYAMVMHKHDCVIRLSCVVVLALSD